MRLRAALAACALAAACAPAFAQSRPIVVGSKNFTESYLLAEILAQLLESRGFPVERRLGFGGTLVCFQALTSGEIDVYPEYTGTISETLLQSELPFDAASAELGTLGLDALPPFGFNNTYALAVTAETAERLSLSRISDLRAHAELSFGFSHEFRERRDGWPGLRDRYGLQQATSGIEHGLAYRALLDGVIDVTDAYSTDGDLLRYGLVVLDDDLSFFPVYLALPLARRALSADAKQVLSALEGRLTDSEMRALNAEITVERKSFGDVARRFLIDRRLIAASAAGQTRDLWRTLARNTLVHLKLTGMAVAAAAALGLGLALAVYRSRWLSTALLYGAGLLQTVPSIALLALLIPVAGVGQRPAVIALFLYSLLPIVRNAVTALLTVDPLLRRVANALGLSHFEQLKHVFLPLALPHLLAGLRIAAVISIGTATLAAFIGAGGLGEPIVTGLALNDTSLILQGAVPAALLALATELLFELLERRLVPAHLMMRQSAP